MPSSSNGQGGALRRIGIVFKPWRDDGAFTFPYTPTTRYTRFRRLSRMWARLRGKLVTG